MDQSITSVRRPSATLLGDERGLSTVEYVVILIVVAGVAIGSWTMFGHQVKCALGLANDTVAAGIGVESTVGGQACAKGGPSSDGGGRKEPGGTPPEEHKKKVKVPRAGG
ncbi:MAG: hypothetical protein ABI895_25530 [Deltaproteobacteria bacterium]